MSKEQPKNNKPTSTHRRAQPKPRRSWLEGPEVPGQYEDPAAPSTYAGENLGLPQSGPGSLAGLFPRMAALLIDWLMCYAMAFFITRMTDALGDYATVAMFTFIVWRIVTVWLFAQSPGHAFLGLGVARIDDGSKRVGPWRSVVRTLLTVFLFPPVIQDTDGRGMHDRATGTAVIRVR
ncbi:RDD family protein [Corynebacterium sp. zg254]|uniref:RDD family protein n=1 Tax=Corynebacterium zhongnanshanii TaxID=2768834 RepID=A0ABQ6VDC2_9CORY|nr:MULTISPECIES: RDD family protein [Corynebacterium]KAB3520857.1 RDD family protein [Corynebacterium zhongnanshanii]MCR5914480.1 RDD family protein [Corynebacterium sp. zg254]